MGSGKQLSAVPNNALKEHKLAPLLTPLLTFPVAIRESKFAYMWSKSNSVLPGSKSSGITAVCTCCLLNGITENELGWPLSSAGQVTALLETPVYSWMHTHVPVYTRQDIHNLHIQTIKKYSQKSHSEQPISQEVMYMSNSILLLCPLFLGRDMTLGTVHI